MRYWVLIALFFSFIPGVAAAQEAPAEKTPIEQRADQVVAFLNGEAEASTIFTDGFLKAVPLAQLNAISTQLTGQFGAALSVESVDPADGTSAALAIRMERAIAKGSIAIDPAQGNRIGGLRFTSFDPIDDSAARIEADLSALPGSVSAYFGPIEGAPGIIAINPETQMPLGSTMKLYVLAALGREIAQGKRAWDDVITLDAKSFPSGQMQNWLLDAPVTLHTLASMMISISDNTATDALIRLLGQEAMADILTDTAHTDAARNTPWMTTRDLFLLKGGDRARLELYRKASPDVRAQILESIEAQAVTTADIDQAFATGPVAIDVEWFANTGDLARLFQLMRGECDPRVFA
ncbi:MAG: serine hydrolase, partial [Erythrobacter sp.]